ncbi:tRNA 2-thiouridine(34) synthase MnmA [Chloroflexota bacterium]
MLTKANTVKVVVAMSGGVDSSVAAALLKEQGYQVSGITMKIWGGEDLPAEGMRHGCYGPGEEEDIEDARKVAQTLGIDFYVFDLRQEYKAEVLDYFCHEYLSGRTPNPCLRCNGKVKFDALLRKTQDSGIGFDYVATGHYARVEYNKSKHRYLLKKARELSKDQSYFISSLSQEQLSRSLFPIGNYTKEEVRNMASDFRLSVSNKQESQDFTTGGYSSLVEAAPPGPILDKQKNILGEHRGIPFYTIGQRKGLGVSAREPLYVTDIDPAKNTIIVGSKEEVYRDELIASGLNWIAIEELERPTKVKARIRHLHQESEAIVTPLNDDKVYVKFNEPQMAITPGQAVVFYHGDVVIGAGTIERARE